MPAFQWSVAEGLRRIEVELEPQRSLRDPDALLRHVKASTNRAGLYVLTGFHPCLDQPLHVRLLEENALAYRELGHAVVLLSHTLAMPEELDALAAHIDLALLDEAALLKPVREQAVQWSAQHGRRKVSADSRTVGRWVQNLRGLDRAEFDVPALTSASAEFSEAEIEQAVVAAAYSAYGEALGVENGDV